jgi:ABC-2 type transport system ATP-binding protein
VDNLSLEVNEGDIFGFIGHNGAGKSTTIKSIVGILDFEEGEITVDGHSVKKEPMRCKQTIAYVPDNPDIYEHLTGIQYLNFVADIFRVSKAEREAAISEYAAAFELTDNLGDLIGSYSHGMRQKLMLISALLHKPKLMIFDEPFVGLDPKAMFTMKEIMNKLCAEGCAVFFSTHVLDVAEKICNRVAIIKDGKLIACGNMEEVRGDDSLEDVFMELIER